MDPPRAAPGTRAAIQDSAGSASADPRHDCVPRSDGRSKGGHLDTFGSVARHRLGDLFYLQRETQSRAQRSKVVFRDPGARTPTLIFAERLLCARETSSGKVVFRSIAR